MEVSIKLNHNFTEQYNKLQNKYGEPLAVLNGFGKNQLNYNEFIDNFIDKDTIADASVDGNSNVRRKDIVTLLNEMPKPHRKLLAFRKIYDEIQKKYGRDIANEWLELEWIGALYLHDGDTSSFKPYCYAANLKDLAERGLYFIDGGFNAEPPKHLTTFVDFVK